MKNSSLMRFTISLLLASLFAAGAVIQAQQPERQGDSVTINTDLVGAWDQISSRKDGKEVKGLGKGAFVLLEDGKPQQISLVKEGQPLSVVMVVWGIGCAKYSSWRLPRIHEA